MDHSYCETRRFLHRSNVWFDLIPLHRRLEVMHMTDYEMLSIILGMAMLIVSIIALCLRAKK